MPHSAWTLTVWQRNTGALRTPVRRAMVGHPSSRFTTWQTSRHTLYGTETRLGRPRGCSRPVAPTLAKRSRHTGTHGLTGVMIMNAQTVATGARLHGAVMHVITKGMTHDVSACGRLVMPGKGGE